MTVSIIIVSYNTAEMTIAAIDSVYKQTTNIDFEVIVVDNASKDNSVKLIEKQFPNLNLIKLAKNIGFAAANNLAAKEVKGEWILLLNPDTIVLDKSIEKIVFFAKEHTEWGIYGGSTFFPDGSRNPTAGWMKPSRWSLFCLSIGLSKLMPKSRLFNPESLEYWDWENPKTVDIVTGCFMLIKKMDWDFLKGFDPQFFMYAEDADICIRASAAGLSSVLYPGAKIIHYGGASEPARAPQMIRLFSAKVQLFYKHYSLNTAEEMKRLLKFLCIIRISMFSVGSVFMPRLKKRKEEWKAIWKERETWLA